MQRQATNAIEHHLERIRELQHESGQLRAEVESAKSASADERERLREEVQGGCLPMNITVHQVVKSGPCECGCELLPWSRFISRGSRVRVRVSLTSVISAIITHRGRGLRGRPRWPSVFPPSCQIHVSHEGRFRPKKCRPGAPHQSLRLRLRALRVTQVADLAFLAAPSSARSPRSTSKTLA